MEIVNDEIRGLVGVNDNDCDYITNLMMMMMMMMMMIMVVVVIMIMMIVMITMVIIMMMNQMTTFMLIHFNLKHILKACGKKRCVELSVITTVNNGI